MILEDSFPAGLNGSVAGTSWEQPVVDRGLAS